MIDRRILNRLTLLLMAAVIAAALAACGGPEPTTPAVTATSPLTTTPPVTTPAVTAPPVTTPPVTPPPATTETLQGLVKSVGQGTLILSLGDGTEVQVKLAQPDAAKGFEGREVEIAVRKTGGELDLVNIKTRGENLVFSGEFQSANPDFWIIRGVAVKVTANTLLDQGIIAGQVAKVEAVKAADGSLLATSIRIAAPEDIRFTGILEAIGPDKWVISGKIFKIGEVTQVDRGLGIGDRVGVDFFINPDGSLVAREIDSEPG